MDKTAPQQEFLTFFDTHVDGLFSHCLHRIPDPVQARELVEKAFKRGWDQIVEGGQPTIDEFYRLLDSLIAARMRARGLFLPTLSDYFSSRMRQSS